MKRLLLLLFCVALLALPGCLGKSIEAKLEKDLQSKDSAVRLDAAKKLGDVATAEAIRLLLLHRDDPDFRVKEEIQRSLKKIDRRTFLN